MDSRELIAEARRLEGDYGDAGEVILVTSDLADALEKTAAERDALAATLERVRGWTDPKFAPGFTAENRLAEISDALDSAPPVARPLPDREELESEVTNGEPGVGWFEWHKQGAMTTHIAHVSESGGIYLPEDGVSYEDFHVASATGDAHRLVRLDAVLAAIEKGGESA